MDKTGKRIRAIREQKNYSQEGVATAAGISQAALSKIEHGISMPKHETLFKIAKSLGVDVREFFPSSVANEVLGIQSLFGVLLFRLRRWWYGRKVKPL